METNNSSDSALPNFAENYDSSFSISFLFLLRYFIAVIGFVANCLVMFCIYSYKKLQKVRNYLVANLAIIDAISLLMDITVFIPAEVPAYGNIPVFESCSFAVAGNTLTFLGLIALTIVSVDRFVYIMMPFYYHNFRKHWIKIVASSWLLFGTCHGVFGILLTCPGFYMEKETLYNMTNLFSFMTWFLVEAVLYSIIYFRAYRQNLALGRSSSANENGVEVSTSGGVPGRNFNPIQKKIIIGYLLIVGIAFITFLFRYENSLQVKSLPGVKAGGMVHAQMSDPRSTKLRKLTMSEVRHRISIRWKPY